MNTNWNTQGQQATAETLSLIDRELTQIIDSQPKAPLEDLEKRETREVVWEALNSLPESQMTVLLLSVYEDKPLEEVAQIMGLNIGLVRHLLFSGKRNLKKKLSTTL